MIYYSIILNDELDFVKLQLDVNYDYVDKFVITESEQIYSGNKKENHFYKNRDVFSKYNDKIIYLDVNLDYFELIKNYPPNIGKLDLDIWSREQRQRNYLFEQIDFNIDDIVINVDVDEIIFLEKCKDKIIKDKVNYFNLDHRKYYFNSKCLKHKKTGWQRSVAFNPLIYKNYIFNVWNIRHFNDFIQDINVINNAGYHFSWCIDIENKIKSFSHQELNDPKTIKKFINYKHVLENCEIVNDLPDFIKLNYSQYFYKHDDL
jgi:beta-1,4-mannosyl-glycoprotein beta-1,4-N-acetylglucosaminyltransferase